MKYLAFGLSSVLISSVSMVAAASAGTVEVTPFQLVFLAYDGYFMDRGISGAGTFINGVEMGQVTPAEIVQAGIDDGRLTPDTMDDQTYLHAVELQMRSFREDHDRK